MTSRHHHFLRAAALALILALGTTGAHAQTPAPSAPPPIADFFDNAAFSGAKLSPNARFLAIRFSKDNARDRLAVIDLASNTLQVVAQFDDRDVASFIWINDIRLVFDSTDKTTAPGDRRYGPGLFAVNRDGSDTRQLVRLSGALVGERGNQNMLSAYHYLTDQNGPQNSEFVYVINPKWSDLGQIEHVNLVRVNTLTGRSEVVQRPGASRHWLLDANGVPRLTTVVDKNMESVYYRESDGAAWRKIASFDSYLGGKGAFAPLSFGPDGTLYVTANIGRDTQALHTYDLNTGKVSDTPLVALDGFDFNGDLVTGGGKLLGIRYLSDAQSTAWADEGMKKVQAAVDAALPDTINLVDVAARAETPWVLVESYSDRQPRSFALFNTGTGKFNLIGSAYPRIRPAAMATQEFVRYKARDGLDVPGWLTVPKGPRKNLPLVVLVHGGPYVRGGEWGWDPDAQFLASRGYAVLEPEFRGSRGYGVRHYRAGWKQWGLAMQNDIADGARWAIAQGIADPKRICIAGASYGGYATLMGLVNDPDLYRCGIGWVGVTDISLLYTGDANYISDISDDYLKYGMPTLVGDLVKDAAQLKATSPIEQAARIKAPLLLAYGASDQRVPLYHGRKFEAAVRAHNAQVEMVVYDDEAHGWTLPKNRFDFWSRVESFLDRHIGKGAGAQGK